MTVWEIQVKDDANTFVPWHLAGGGDAVVFATYDAAKAAAVDTRELSDESEDVSWRIQPIEVE